MRVYDIIRGCDRNILLDRFIVILVKNKKDINEIDMNLTIAQDFFKIKANNDP